MNRNDWLTLALIATVVAVGAFWVSAPPKAETRLQLALVALQHHEQFDVLCKEDIELYAAKKAADLGLGEDVAQQITNDFIKYNDKVQEARRISGLPY